MCGINGPWRHYEGTPTHRLWISFVTLIRGRFQSTAGRLCALFALFSAPSCRAGIRGDQKNTGNSGVLPSPATLGVAYSMKLSGSAAPQ